jgi:pyrimidine deaminase RibD-like protein
MPANTFMDLALDEAHAAADMGEVPIGCVIVHDGDMIAQAGNRTLADRDPTAHAEMVAIRQAAASPRPRRRRCCRPSSAPGAENPRRGPVTARRILHYDPSHPPWDDSD